ncbi:MAG: DEAD/DEAH box helicase [Gemmatimonadetes bacterium]|nr:DEAD/DEAH box helicase [Gemmatimonadota bacterium]
MGEKKRERQRRKRAEKRKRKARAEAQQAQREARMWQSYLAADRAELHLRRRKIAEALRDAAHAAALNPKDPAIAALYVAAAERWRDPADHARALEHLAGVVKPDMRLFAQLAYRHLQAGDTARAREAARRARALLPARMKDRKHWLSLLEYVEAAPRAAPETTPAAEAVAPPPRPDPPPQAPAPTFLDVPVEITADVDGLDVLSSDAFSPLEDVELARLAARIRDMESYQRLFAIERAQGLLRFSHQEETARRVLSVLLGRALLADEVGLGKTIEAGLVLLEYLLRGRVERALVLVPSSLVDQWKEELATKFGIEARTTEDPGFRDALDDFWSRSGVVIASLATARSSRQRNLVTARSWDVVIVDEAHVLKNARTESYALVSRITSRFLLLLTATPVENRIEELYNLVSLIRPGHLGGRAAFVKRFSDSKGRPSEAARAEVRALLGEVMVRNTRALSGVQLPPRFARTVLVPPDPGEAELYGHLAAALRAIGPGGRTRLLLSVLLQEAGSSPLAVRATLQKLRDGDDLAPGVAEALAPAIRCAERPMATGKSAALLRVLDGASEPAVVFTRFRATLDFLASMLRQAGVACEPIHGDMPAPLRNQAIARLRERGGVLLSTEVGAEGLNLQYCRRIVNFDLPWNPMRIEQRIGRVHRIVTESICSSWWSGRSK